MSFYLLLSPVLSQSCKVSFTNSRPSLNNETRGGSDFASFHYSFPLQTSRLQMDSFSFFHSRLFIRSVIFYLPTCSSFAPLSPFPTSTLPSSPFPPPLSLSLLSSWPYFHHPGIIYTLYLFRTRGHIHHWPFLVGGKPHNEGAEDAHHRHGHASSSGRKWASNLGLGERLGLMKRVGVAGTGGRGGD